MKALVTGGAGMIGANLCQKLLDRGFEVFCVDNLITGDEKNIDEFKKNKRFKFLQIDIASDKLPENLWKEKFDLVFDLACPTGVPNLEKIPIEMLLTSSIGTKNTLEIAKKSKAQFLLASSSEVYGDPQISPQRETYTGEVDPVGPRSAYEEGKRFAESLTMAYVRKYKLKGKIVRIFNTYGPKMSDKDERVIPNFLKNALKGKPLPIFGDGRQTRTFLHIDDLIDGFFKVLDKGKDGEVYNLGSDQPITINNLAKLILKLTRSKSKIVFKKAFILDHKGRLPNLSKIKKLGWKPKTSLEKGLQKVIGG